MSLAYYTQPQTRMPAWDGEGQNANKDIEVLDRYLAILEDNKRACRFIPDDVAVSLEMTGFVRNTVEGRRGKMGSSVARLALALIQPEAGPLQ